LSLPIPSIGEAAEQEISGKGVGFTRRKRAAVVTAAPARKNGSAGVVEHPARNQSASDTFSTSFIRRRR
jgi:hypothetical protein